MLEAYAINAVKWNLIFSIASEKCKRFCTHAKTDKRGWKRVLRISALISVAHNMSSVASTKNKQLPFLVSTILEDYGQHFYTKRLCSVMHKNTNIFNYQ